MSEQARQTTEQKLLPYGGIRCGNNGQFAYGMDLDAALMDNERLCNWLDKALQELEDHWDRNSAYRAPDHWSRLARKRLQEIPK